MNGCFKVFGLFFWSAAALAAPPTSRLQWGNLFDEGNPSPTRKAALTRVLQVADASVTMKVDAVSALHLAGTLNRDPGHIESDRVKAEFPAIFDLAVCARLGAADRRETCRSKAREAVLLWAKTYRVTGNPIDEGYLLPILETTDLLWPVLGDADRAVLAPWIRSFATQGDLFFAKMNPATDSRLKNNWSAWRFLLRGVVAKIVDDAALAADTRTFLRNFVAGNLPPARGGESFDFVQRDALHYHAYDLEPLVKLALSAPDLFDAATRANVTAGLLFLKPFFTGEKTHIEFLHTTVPFDIQRKDAGQVEFENLPWDPSHARALLRLARPIFPEVRPWTAGVVDEAYDPMIKLLAAIFGETLLPAAVRF